MQVTETLSNGLKRELRIVIGSSELDARLVERLEEIKNSVQLKGFRRGRVPMSHLRRTFAKRVMPEVVENVVQETSRRALDERRERPIVQPRISFGDGEDEGTIAGVMAGESDLAFTMAFEVMPEIEQIEFSRIELTRPVAAVCEEEVAQALESVRHGQRRFRARPVDANAEKGDRVTVDYVGRIGGEPFEGGAGEDTAIEIGSGAFLPGFEDQLEGAVTGEERELKITFPEDYGAKNLAGQDATFAVTVKEVAEPIEPELDDELAKGLGLESLDKLKEAVRERIEADYAAQSRSKLKRRLLDELDGRYAFELPPSLVESEFERIWSEVTQSLERSKRSFEDEGTTEEKARGEYRGIAERRVRLGLVLADIGEKNGIEVVDEEVNRALIERARAFPGREAEIFEYYRNNPQAMIELRSPIVEEKVVDFVIELAQVEDAEVGREELFAEDDGGHDHDHDHDHEHDHDHDHDHGAAAEKPKRKRRTKPAAKS